MTWSVKNVGEWWWVHGPHGFQITLKMPAKSSLKHGRSTAFPAMRCPLTLMRPSSPVRGVRNFSPSMTSISRVFHGFSCWIWRILVDKLGLLSLEMLNDVFFPFFFGIMSWYAVNTWCLSAWGNCNNLRRWHTKIIVGVVTDEEIRGFELGFEAPILCRYPQYWDQKIILGFDQQPPK